MLLEVKDLSINYKTVYGNLRVLNKINLSADAGECVSLVGESGSGKSTLGLSIAKLLPPNATYAGGSLILDGKDMVKITKNEAVAVRGRSVFMIFQDPLNSLNPVQTVGTQLLTALEIQSKRQGRKFNSKIAQEECIEKLNEIRIPDPEILVSRYPHQLSGGQIQRILIAMGLLIRPKLIIADEPTSALDVTVQAQVLKLMNELKEDHKISIIFITHDISVAYTISDRMAVMYAGEVSEIGPADRVASDPLHPYARALIKSLPKGNKALGSLESVAGSQPDMFSPPPGCRFHPRCPLVMERCKSEVPEPKKIDGNLVRCHLYG